MLEQIWSGVDFCKRCRIIVEPFVILQVLANAIAGMTEGQYILHRIATKHGAVEGTGSQAMSVACEASRGNSSNHSLQHKLQDTQQETSHWNIYFSLTGAIPTMVTIVILGRFADKLGHKKMLAFNAVIGTASGIFDTFCLAFHWPLWTLLISNVVYGCIGSNAAILAFSHAYLSDMTTAADRQIRISILAFAIGIVTTMFSIVNGYLIQAIGYTYTMFFSDGFSIVSLVYMVFLFPTQAPRPDTADQYDDLSTNDPLTDDIKDMGIWELIKDSYRPVYFIVLPLIVYFLDAFQASGVAAVLTTYVMGSPFCFDSVALGNYAAIYGMIGLFGTIAAILLLSGRVHSMLLSAMGSAMGIVSSSSLALATSRTTLYISGAFSLFTGICDPVLRSFLSLHLPSSVQGTLFAVLGFISSLCSLIGQPVFNEVYAASLKWMPGFVFFICTFCAATCAILSVVTYIKTRNSATRLIEQTDVSYKAYEANQSERSSAVSNDRNGFTADKLIQVSSAQSSVVSPNNIKTKEDGNITPPELKLRRLGQEINND